ncbi:MAG: GIY-YIG nuclease family protein [Gemmatimonadota bacterium]|nr:GIY-YIG nuclease family protein [Gemmatimonadota bacterium]MDE3127261.1 GIY-YIG nuclease family protein [Gemmatimonadota bacterium]
MGVFQVRNTVTGAVLLGTSTDLPSMLNRQRAALRMRGHPHRGLQTDWNALGAESFEFDILDTLDPPDTPGYDPADDLRTLEELWRGKISAAGGTVYNAPKKR